MRHVIVIAILGGCVDQAHGEFVEIERRVDELGIEHVRHARTHEGLDVVGGEIVVHDGGDADGWQGAIDRAASPSLAAVDARAIVQADRAAMAVGTPRLVYVVSTADHRPYLAWEVRSEGERVGEPVDDLVYVDGDTGETVDVHPQIHAARTIYDARHGSSLPGTYARGESSPPTGDTAVDIAHANLGAARDCYATTFGRNSYDGNGASLWSTVHYGVHANTAYWNGYELVFGDGDGQSFGSLAQALDVTVHELSHGVTQFESRLVMSNESGAINESWSDAMAALCESHVRGGVTAATWKLGEDAYTPGTADDAVRYLDNPHRDGVSADYYPSRWQGSFDNGYVHRNAGIANLAFYLAAMGGSHPRGLTTTVVAGIGLDRAAQIWYRANTTYLTSTSGFADARAATIRAAGDLYGAASPQAASVASAWTAVGVN